MPEIDLNSISVNIELIIKIITPILIIGLGFLLGNIAEIKLKKLCENLNNNEAISPYISILESFKGVLFIWCIVGAIALALPMIKLLPSLNTLVEKILIVIALGAATLLASRLAVNAVKIYSLKNESTVSLTSLFEYLTKVLIFSIGFLIIIQSIGIQITALITAFGVGSLSIGLAFQNTLSNLISGVNIIVSRKIRPGDYLQLKDGEEGYVKDVELKYTVIKDIFNNIIVIPNSRLIDASFKNYSLEEEGNIITIKVAIAYDSDLEKVEKVTLNVAKYIIDNVQGGNQEVEPFMRYENFDYFSINLSIYIPIKEYFDRFLITHEFIKKLSKVYEEENIQMAFPLKNPYFSQEIYGKLPPNIPPRNI